MQGLKQSSSSARPVMTGLIRRLLIKLLLEPEKLYLHAHVTTSGVSSSAQHIQIVLHPG